MGILRLGPGERVFKDKDIFRARTMDIMESSVHAVEQVTLTGNILR